MTGPGVESIWLVIDTMRRDGKISGAALFPLIHTRPHSASEIFSRMDQFLAKAARNTQSHNKRGQFQETTHIVRFECSTQSHVLSAASPREGAGSLADER
jgi:hypothetical protein